MFNWKEEYNIKLLALLESSDLSNVQLAIMMAHGSMSEDEFFEFIVAANCVLSGSDFCRGDWGYIIGTIPVVRLISRGYCKLNDEALDIWFSVKAFRENFIGIEPIKRHLEYNSYKNWNRHKVSFNPTLAEKIIAAMVSNKEKDTEVLSTIIRNLPRKTKVDYLNKYGILYYLKYSAYPRKNLRIFKELYYGIMSEIPKSYRSKIVSI